MGLGLVGTGGSHGRLLARERCALRHLRRVLLHEHDHHKHLETALGKDVADVTSHDERA